MTDNDWDRARADLDRLVEQSRAAAESRRRPRRRRDGQGAVAMSPDPREELITRLTALRMPTVPPQAVDDLAAREFTATDGADGVSATVSGAGGLRRLDVSVSATRGEARAALPARVVVAVNAALDLAAAAQRDLLPGASDVTEKLEALTAQFTARMDGLLARLDEIERGLPGG